MIAPSMLRCDFSNLHREVESLVEAGAPLLHWDVMDGHFVPNLSYGAMVIRSVRELTDLPFEAHLMISDPEKYLPDFLDAGCDLLTIHVEAVPQPAPLLRRIRDAGCAAGLAINPETPVDAIVPALAACDAVLVMSVHPGFGGQRFLPEALDKLRRLRVLVGPQTLLSVDGGIAPETIAATAAAGARQFVVGSAIFEASDYREAIHDLRDAARCAAVSAPRE
ncbi:MAG: ribulose-phosphate 3-epimerase [Planctomycetaceae bacterium]